MSIINFINIIDLRLDYLILDFIYNIILIKLLSLEPYL